MSAADAVATVSGIAGIDCGVWFDGLAGDAALVTRIEVARGALLEALDLVELIYR